MGELLSSAEVKTQKPHKCWGCCKEYPAGTKMQRVAWKDMGELKTFYWCDDCLQYISDKDYPLGEGFEEGEIGARRAEEDEG